SLPRQLCSRQERPLRALRKLFIQTGAQEYPPLSTSRVRFAFFGEQRIRPILLLDGIFGGSNRCDDLRGLVTPIGRRVLTSPHVPRTLQGRARQQGIARSSE